jgi:NAD(P)-dependent dehydrogenase (short-subunit alcohol dehydrogenase family)
MADEDSIRQVVERHRDRYGRLDVLVNNAGVGIGAPATCARSSSSTGSVWRCCRPPAPSTAAHWS